MVKITNITHCNLVSHLHSFRLSLETLTHACACNLNSKLIQNLIIENETMIRFLENIVRDSGDDTSSSASEDISLPVLCDKGTFCNRLFLHDVATSTDLTTSPAKLALCDKGTDMGSFTSVQVKYPDQAPSLAKVILCDKGSSTDNVTWLDKAITPEQVKSLLDMSSFESVVSKDRAMPPEHQAKKYMVSFDKATDTMNSNTMNSSDNGISIHRVSSNYKSESCEKETMTEKVRFSDIVRKYDKWPYNDNIYAQGSGSLQNSRLTSSDVENSITKSDIIRLLRQHPKKYLKKMNIRNSLRSLSRGSSCENLQLRSMLEKSLVEHEKLEASLNQVEGKISELYNSINDEISDIPIDQEDSCFGCNTEDNWAPEIDNDSYVQVKLQNLDDEVECMLKNVEMNKLRMEDRSDSFCEKLADLKTCLQGFEEVVKKEPLDVDTEILIHRALSSRYKTS